MGRDVERAESEEDLEQKRKEEEEELKAAKKRQVNKGTLKIMAKSQQGNKETILRIPHIGNFGQHWRPGGCHHHGIIGSCHCQLQGVW